MAREMPLDESEWVVAVEEAWLTSWHQSAEHLVRRRDLAVAEDEETGADYEGDVGVGVGMGREAWLCHSRTAFQA